MHESAGILAWLAGTALSKAMLTWLWLYPIVEIVHIVGFVMLVGAAAMFDLRLLGLSRGIPVQALARHLLPWSVAGLALIVPAGLLMFTAHPQEWADSTVFRIKMALIVAAGVNAAAFHFRIYRTVAGWNSDVVAPPLARIHALLSLGLWIAVIACGRLLAYT
jgi:hypothetical protein